MVGSKWESKDQTIAVDSVTNPGAKKQVKAKT